MLCVAHNARHEVFPAAAAAAAAAAVADILGSPWLFDLSWRPNDRPTDQPN